MTSTFQDLLTKLRSEIWPSGEPRSLRPSHNTAFQLALNNLQREVPCLEANNTTIIPYCSTYFSCGLSAVDFPIGKVKRVYTLANDDWCDKVIYRPATMEMLRCWSNNILQVDPPTNSGMPKLPMGFKFAEKSTDKTCGRSRNGKWAQDRSRLYLSPWIDSNEKIVIEWDGIRQIWADADVLDLDVWGFAEQNAIKAFVAWQHEVFFGEDMALRQTMEEAWLNGQADVIYNCNERRRVPESEACSTKQVITAAQLEDDAVPAAETFTVGVIGQYGQAGTPEADVAEMIADQGAGIILATGGNSVAGDLANDITQYYENFIDRSDVLKNKFWPAWGAQDWPNLAALMAYFKLPNNERYYQVVYGPFHFFVLSSNPLEVDGGYVDATTSTRNSIMGNWLATMVALSTAEWKIAVVPDAPYTSESVKTPGAQWMRWNYAAMGINLVLGGGNQTYEHLIVGGLDYINIGLGGQALGTFGTALSGSQTRYRANYGGLILTATEDELTSVLVARDDSEVETVTISK